MIVPWSLTNDSRPRSTSRDEENKKEVKASRFDSLRRIPMLKPAVTLCLLNIPSFAGGADVWRSSEKKLGLTIPEECDPALSRKIESCLPSEVIQDFGDGRLEVLTFQSITELGASNIHDSLGKIFPAGLLPSGWRIFRGGGFFELRFRKDLSPKERLYFQVDGEYYVGHQLKRLCVSPDTRVQILVRPDKRPDQTHGRRKSQPLEDIAETHETPLSPVEACSVSIEGGVPTSPTSHAASTESEDCFEGTNRRPSVLLRDIQPLVPDLTQVGEEEVVSSG
eukprot:Protomagalhaensia_wolfi_Nauph_80__2810@NODE_291_length_2890_cov_83_890915_g214_i1_p2_GENE_NODE_291_length_2890_cov_83_890915_g214_i1NODE_291_length_2890_cov_83_890915_g214_i1_p2_ORF_typecomplete_len280_score36_94DAGK_acc/PF00609_19/6_3e12_NODE_291_length_2890_cov_83_890915_g214_i118582697